MKDNNARVAQDNGLLRREADKLMGESYDLRKELDFQNGKNINAAN